MADEEVATKAPESDAAQQSVIPGDTPAQEGPTLGVRQIAHLALELLEADC